MSSKAEAEELRAGNFVREVVRADVAANKNGGRVVTRFPPEPNGYPHLGHLKSICINFGIAKEFDGRCHLRFDDTNPETEDAEYVEAFQRDIRWMGFDWGEHLFYASDYFDQLYGYAQQLIRAGRAYVCSLSEAELREYRGTLTEPGRDSPFRERSIDENLDLFSRMREGQFEAGAHVLRAKIDMASPNMKMRDPAIYRIRHEPHYRTGSRWHVYPLYDFAHCLSDAIEGVTHSLCSHEFENNRELYDWFIDHLAVPAHPVQHEFGRFNVAYTITSKRKLRALIEAGHVSGWDDPRMPTVAGFRRRGYPPRALRQLMERTGVSRTPSTVDLSLMEFFVREQLNAEAPRVLCVIDPLRLVIDNYPSGQRETLDAPHFPPDIGLDGSRAVTFARTLYVERSDFADPAPDKWHRLAPGASVRLRHAYVVTCREVVRDATGQVTELHCTYEPDSQQGDSSRRVKGTIHWVAAEDALSCEVRLYDRLFSDPEPDRGRSTSELAEVLTPNSLVIAQGKVERSVAGAQPGTRFQFERQGFFVVDSDSEEDALVFNRIVALRDSWAKISGSKQKPGRGGDPARRKRKEAKARRDASASQGGPTAAGGPKASATRELSPEARAFASEFSLTEEAARLLTRDPAVTSRFREGLTAGASARALANWFTTELLRELKDRPVDALPFTGRNLGELVKLTEDGAISNAAAKEVFTEMLASGAAPQQVVADRGLSRLNDDSQLLPIVDAVLADHPEHVAKYRGGQHGLLGALIGQVMRRTRGRADAPRVDELLRKRLDA